MKTSTLPAHISLPGGITLGNDQPLVLLAGLNVLESEELALKVAWELQQICGRLGLPLVFKASFDKANRSSVRSFRGPGLQEGLETLWQVNHELGLPIVTDLHDPLQAEAVAQVADLLQIPAFLCRQTDLVAAAAATGKPLHIKKMQMMAPGEMANVVDKCAALGATGVVLCERGTSFGYNNLVVDPLSFPQLKQLGVPVSFDVTHALQQPGALGGSTGGRREQLEPLARAGVSAGLAALFLEVHPEPDEALCDGPCALALEQVEPLLKKLVQLDELVKGW